MAEKNTKPDETVTPVAAKPTAPVISAERIKALAELRNCSIEEATKSETERLAKKR